MFNSEEKNWLQNSETIKIFWKELLIWKCVGIINASLSCFSIKFIFKKNTENQVYFFTKTFSYSIRVIFNVETMGSEHY